MFKKVNIFFLKKSFIVIFLIRLFQWYNLDYKFDGMSYKRFFIYFILFIFNSKRCIFFQKFIHPQQIARDYGGYTDLAIVACHIPFFLQLLICFCRINDLVL